MHYVTCLHALVEQLNTGKAEMSQFLNPRMGCCMCRLLEEVEQDPSVSFYTTVGDVGLFRSAESSLIPAQRLGRHDGIMYVKDDTLFYESKLCGRLCWKCARQSFKLSMINSVKYREEDKVSAYGRGYRVETVLSPGLRIATNDVLIAVAAPDAAVFSEQLKQACNIND